MFESTEGQIAELESVLGQQVAAHEELVLLLKRKREALSAGQAKALPELCALENEKFQLIGELEKHRAALAAALTLSLSPRAERPMRLGELAERLSEPARGRLLVLRQQLAERIRQVQESAAIGRRATEALQKHVQGLVQTVGAMSTGVGTYGAKGGRPQQATAVRTLNLTA